jgi:hypothetical protein
MPRVGFNDLKDTARVWVFASDRPLVGNRAARLLAEVDRFLEGWAAHGAALTCARDWREDRFLIVAVDEDVNAASGCSIDGLFRRFKELEPELGASLLGGENVFYRDERGSVASVTRDEFSELGAAGVVHGTTRVFDPTVTRMHEFREHFEIDAARSWHAVLLPSLPPPTTPPQPIAR